MIRNFKNQHKLPIEHKDIRITSAYAFYFQVMVSAYVSITVYTIVKLAPRIINREY
jgi:hypothetical protein